ncbi:MAG TPA: hypothetical protein VEX18_00675, partial [Polyangiaceae bacterium]|nr:hypothetical protein [Polyangiaceae bacterium]
MRLLALITELTGDGLAAQVLRSGRLCGKVTKPFRRAHWALRGEQWRRPSRRTPDQITYALYIFA